MKIIMYHYIRDYSKSFPNLKFLKRENFIKQLDYFENKYGIANLQDWKNLFKNKESKSNKVLLTFDDGLKEHYDFVFKELKKRDKVGLFFIPTKIFEKNGFLDVHKIHLLLAKIDIKLLFTQLKSELKKIKIRKFKNDKLFMNSYDKQKEVESVKKFKRILNYQLDSAISSKIVKKLIKLNNIYLNKKNFYLSKKNIKEMSNQNMLIGSHTNSHPVLSNLSKKKQKNEITKSVNILKKILNKKVNVFSYPYGIKDTFNMNTFEILKANNIEFAFKANFDINSFYNQKYKNFNTPRNDCNKFKHGQCE